MLTESRGRIALAAVSLLTLPLFLTGLGATYLWQDEAQTALLARSVVQHGVPVVGTGAGSLSAHLGSDAGIRGIYFHISWLQAYVAAASFQLFGESSWAARLPFALSGWLCVPLAGLLVMRTCGGAAAAVLAALLLGTHVPFIVAARQARYYALTAVLVLLAALAYVELLKRVENGRGARTAASALAAATALLALAFDLTAIGVMGALALHWIAFGPARGRGGAAFWAAWTASVALLSAWIWISLSAPMRSAHSGIGPIPDRVWHAATYYAGQIDAYVLPLPIVAVAALAAWRRSRSATLVLSIVACGALGGVMLSPYRFFRYMVPAIPFLFALTAVALATVAGAGRAARGLVAALVLVFICSNALQSASHWMMTEAARATRLIVVQERPVPLRFPPVDFIRELRDPPHGPIAATVAYLRRHSRPGDVLVTTYGELPLKFHTNLAVFGGETGEVPPHGVRPRWLWPRQDLKIYPTIRAAAKFIDKRLHHGAYRRIELDAIDRRWENREDPAEHIFTNPGPPGPRVVLYEAVE